MVLMNLYARAQRYADMKAQAGRRSGPQGLKDETN